MRRLRIVTAAGDVVEIGEDEPDLLHAAQVAVGMLGVITEVELEVAPAYRLRERIEHWTLGRGVGAVRGARACAPPLLVLLDAVRGVGRAVRPREPGVPLADAAT